MLLADAPSPPSPATDWWRARRDDLLDLAMHVTRTSRLACQIVIPESDTPVTVKVPPGARDWSHR